jgi:hypothetical protein
VSIGYSDGMLKVNRGYPSAPEQDGRGSESLLDRVTSVRRALSSRECDPVVLARLYQRYNPVPDVEAFVGHALRIFPRLCCGLASVYLRHCLKEGVVTCGSYGDEPHSFLLRRDGIVDITADQFGGPEVYVGPLKAPWHIRAASGDARCSGGAKGHMKP